VIPPLVAGRVWSRREVANQLIAAFQLIGLNE
jgi:hypothetical protein